VIVWDAATGNSNCRRKIVDHYYCVVPGYWRSTDRTPRVVAVSNGENWILVVGIEYSDEHALFFSLTPRVRGSSGAFRCRCHWGDEWSAAFTSDGCGFAVPSEYPQEGTNEEHEWLISDAGEMVEFGNGTAPNALPTLGLLECKSRERPSA
jgi:hypothetical protein